MTHILTSALILGALLASAQTPLQKAGLQADGSIVLPTDQVIRPAGKLIPFEGRPTAIALRPDGRTAAVLKSGGSYIGPGQLEHILTVDIVSGEVKQRFLADGQQEQAGQAGGSQRAVVNRLFSAAQGSFTGIAYSPDGSRLCASDSSGSIIIADVSPEGTLTKARRVVMPVADPKRGTSHFVEEGRNTANPGGLAFTSDGKRLVVVLNMNNSVAIVDLAGAAVVREIAVGNAPHSVVIEGSRAFVSNEGGRPAERSEYTNLSAGVPIVADPASGRPTSGTVSVVDLEAGKQVATVKVGLHPTAMLLDGGRLFVSNANSDTVSVVDIKSLATVKTITIQPFFHAPFGSSPGALAMLPNSRLAVALSGNNAIAIYDWNRKTLTATLAGLLPTAWYPSDIAIDKSRSRMVVSALKGNGLDAEAAPGQAKTIFHLAGSISLIPYPSKSQLVSYTRQVIENNRWKSLTAATPVRSSSALAKAIPDRIGDPSLIKHVVYIIKENKTYDQVFGAEQRGNGDPKLEEFGRTVTPNAHSLVADFPLLDNFYVSSLASADGHQWANSAFVDDYVERGFAYGFPRSYPFNGGDSLAYAPTGFLWENALRHGRSVRVFGEYVPQFVGPRERYGQWSDWYRDAQIMQGKISGELHTSPGEFQAKSDIPSLDGILNRDYPPYDTRIPDQYRVEIFLKEFRQRVADGNLPDLMILTLCDDHTTGVTPRVPTPRAQIADNDLAFGRVVEAISNSPFWRDTAIFVVQDDAAGGLDHVDGHRSPAFVISPYTKRQFVDHTYYTQIDVVRTIEQILGLPPMNQHDLAASPMSSMFTDQPDITPYKAVPNEISLEEMNPETSGSRLQLEWQKASAKMFSAWPPVPDAQDPNLLNRAIWYGTNGYHTAYPGDDRVLRPTEVRRSKRDRD